MSLKKLKNLDDCLEYLSCLNIDQQLCLTIPENDASVLLHHGIGTAIRNDMNLWDENTELSKYFRSIGIVHGDDKSSIILTSYHRKINGKPIDLEEQIIKYWKHWKEYSTEYLPINIDGVDDEYLKLYIDLITNEKEIYDI